MSITKITPKTILLGGTQNPVIISDLLCSEAITPGHLVERASSSGTPKWRKHSTAAGMAQKAVALNMSMLNKGCDDASTASDLIEVVIAQPGVNLWMLLASGENVVIGDFLESKGDGTLRKYGSGVRLFTMLEDVNNTAGPSTTRVRVEAL